MKILIIVLVIILFNVILDQWSKYKFKKNNFPPNIIFPLKEDIKLPEVEEANNITKKIYRCHKNKKDIDKYQEVIDKTKKLMPEYEQIIYDDQDIENFIKNNFNERIWNAYNAINPKYGPAKADFFRYLIIYLHGGVYLDIKSGPVSDEINKIIDKNQDKLLTSIGQNFPVGLIPRFHLLDNNYDDWSAFTGTYYNEYVQWFIISPKGNKIIKEMIKQMVSNIEYGLENKEIYNKGNISVVAMTGPIAYSLVIQRNKDKKVRIFNNGLNGSLYHHLVDYKKIEKGKHYRNLKDKNVLL